jgi:hypothetical protein
MYSIVSVINRDITRIQEAKAKQRELKCIDFKGLTYSVIRTTDFELVFFRNERFIKKPPKELKKRARHVFALSDAEAIHES